MQYVEGVQQTNAEGRPVRYRTFSLHRIAPSDGEESRMSLVIGKDLLDPHALAYDMPLSSFLELLRGNVTPPEILALYGGPVPARDLS